MHSFHAFLTTSCINYHKLKVCMHEIYTVHLYQDSKGDGDANETYRDNNNIHENIKVKLEAKSFLFVIIDS